MDEIILSKHEENNNSTENSNIINEENNNSEKEITELKTDKTKVQEFVDFVKDLIIIVFIVLVIRTYIAAPFQISGSSMETSYHDWEFIIVNKFTYAWEFGKYISNPNRWDVVVFRPHASNWKEYYIKRVVWMPGDSIKFQDWEVFIKKAWSSNFIKLNEDYLSVTNKWKTFLPFDVKETEFIVPEWEYFLVWDNRGNSSDSRSCFMSCSIIGSSHFIKRSDIIWRVFLNFGHFDIIWTDVNTGKSKIGELKWLSKPRFFNTPYIWDYKELN